jgi:hypothetical protein
MEEKMVLFKIPRIVSVSRRTDIPAFYGEWFKQRVRQGWAVSCNPFSCRPSGSRYGRETNVYLGN